MFYEAPHRIVEALEDVVEVLGGEREVVVAREVTKIHEEFLRGTAADILANLKARDAVKGEITLLIGKSDETANAADALTRQTVRERVKQIMQEEKIDEKAALKKVAKERGVSKSEAYRELQREK